MPRYEYHCPANGRTIEVSHAMSDEVSNWSELCLLADIDPNTGGPNGRGATPGTAPVEKVLSLPFVGSSKSPGWTPGAPPGGGPGSGGCGTGCGCVGR